MRYLQTYEKHNEGIKSAVLGAALGASLFANSPTVSAQSLVKPALTNPTSKDGINAAVVSVYSRFKSVRMYGRDIIALPEALADNGFATNK